MYVCVYSLKNISLSDLIYQHNHRANPPTCTPVCPWTPPCPACPLASPAITRSASGWYLVGQVSLTVPFIRRDWSFLCIYPSNTNIKMPCYLSLKNHGLLLCLGYTYIFIWGPVLLWWQPGSCSSGCTDFFRAVKNVQSLAHLP